MAAGRDFILRGIDGEVVMLNLLRLRETADYSGAPELAPEAPISGREAYDRYIAHTRPFLAASGGHLDLVAEGGAFLIGPPDERWDLVMLVRQKDTETFLSFEQDAAYMAGTGHRTAAIEDSRLLPLKVVAPQG
jgi:hypothetical protein